MNVILIDTSAWISYFAGKGHGDIDMALQEGRVYVSPLVISELLSGRMKSSQRKQLIHLLSELPLCDTSFQHWVRVGNLRSDLLKKGLKISTPDAHIAQCCFDMNCFLLSEDHIFFKMIEYKPLRLYPL